MLANVVCSALRNYLWCASKSFENGWSSCHGREEKNPTRKLGKTVRIKILPYKGDKASLGHKLNFTKKKI